MSIFHPVTMACGNCGEKAEVERSASVNADRRPALRDAILDGSFQATTCRKCGTVLRLPPHLTYLAIDRGQWIMAEAATALENWPTHEAEASKTYAKSFGAEAPPSGRALGEGLQARLVFGWPALREKLICADLQLDDVTLELLKMAVMRDVDGPPMADQTELRLVGGNTETLDFAWLVTLTEQVLATLPVPRDIYDEIAAAPEDWEAARAKFDGALLVDLRRLIMGPAIAQAAE